MIEIIEKLIALYTAMIMLISAPTLGSVQKEYNKPTKVSEERYISPTAPTRDYRIVKTTELGKDPFTGQDVTIYRAEFEEDHGTWRASWGALSTSSLSDLDPKIEELKRKYAK